MANTSKAAIDALGREFKEDMVVTYAVTEGRSAVIRFGVILKVAINKSGAWKLKVRPVYSPTGWRNKMHAPDERTRSIEASPRVFISELTEEQLRERAKFLDAKDRLDA